VSRGHTVNYNAWGAVIDDTSVPEKLKAEKRTDDGKALTAAYVAGPRIRIEETDLVSFQVHVITASTLVTVFAQVELSFDGIVWQPLTAGTTPTIVGSAPNEVLESKALPLVRRHEVSGDDDGFHMNYEVRATFARLLLRGDVAVAASRIRASAGI